MKTISKTIILFLVFTFVQSHSQNKNEKQKQIETLLESKEFVFIAEKALPQGLQSVLLSSSNNFFKMHRQTMEGHLPYFGRAYSGIPYGGDVGIQFNAAPSQYELKKHKKDYEIITIVKGETETYKLTLTVGFDGQSTLHVYSNKRSSISYYGNISPIENDNEKKE